METLMMDVVKLLNK